MNEIRISNFNSNTPRARDLILNKYNTLLDHESYNPSFPGICLIIENSTNLTSLENFFYNSPNLDYLSIEFQRNIKKIILDNNIELNSLHSLSKMSGPRWVRLFSNYNIEELVIKGNHKIKALPLNFGYKENKIKRIEISSIDTKLFSLSNDIGDLRNLKELVFENLIIKDSFLISYLNIETLELINCKHRSSKTFNNFVFKFEGKLTRLKNLKKLTISSKFTEQETHNFYHILSQFQWRSGGNKAIQYNNNIDLFEAGLKDRIESGTNLTIYSPKQIKAILSMRHLTYLDISGLLTINSIPIPEGSLPSLKELKVNFIRFKRDSLFLLTLKNIYNIEVLSLNECQLLEFPNIFDLVNLKKLSLSKNEIEIIPEELGTLTKLEELDLSFNKYTSLPETLGNLHSLKILNLTGSPILILPANLHNIENIISEDYRELLTNLGELTTSNIQYNQHNQHNQPQINNILTTVCPKLKLLDKAMIENNNKSSNVVTLILKIKIPLGNLFLQIKKNLVLK